MAISQGIEEEDISFARELLPKTRQHGLALGIHQQNDEEGDLEEEDDGDAEKEEKVRMMMRRQDGKENRRQEQEEEMSEHESDLSSASESVSLEVVGQSLDFPSLDSLSHQHIHRCRALAGMTDPPIFPPASSQVL